MSSDNYSAGAAGVHAEKAVEHLAAGDLIKAARRHSFLVTETNKIGAALQDALMRRDVGSSLPRVAGRLPSLATKTTEELADIIRVSIDWDHLNEFDKQELEAVADEIERRFGGSDND